MPRLVPLVRTAQLLLDLARAAPRAAAQEVERQEQRPPALKHAQHERKAAAVEEGRVAKPLYQRGSNRERT